MPAVSVARVQKSKAVLTSITYATCFAIAADTRTSPLRLQGGVVPGDGEAAGSSPLAKRIAPTNPMPTTNKELAILIRDVIGARPKYGDESARPTYWPDDVPWQKGKSISQVRFCREWRRYRHGGICKNVVCAGSVEGQKRIVTKIYGTVYVEVSLRFHSRVGMEVQGGCVRDVADGKGGRGQCCCCSRIPKRHKSTLKACRFRAERKASTHSFVD